MKCFMPTIIIAMLCLFVTEKSFAQKQKPKVHSTLPTCDKAIADAKKANQAEADASCQTVYQCVPCQDAKTKKETCKSVAVQPTCSTAAKITKKESKDKSGKLQKNPPFQVEVIQKPCGNGSISYDVVVAQDGEATFNKKTQEAYSFKWMVDGQDAGSASDISCVRAKEASVSVTKKQSGATITLYIGPPTAISSNAASMAPVPTIAASYKKTGCFGLCPIYEVQFLADGRVKWDGKMNVGTMGVKESTVDKETLAQIEQTADKIKFFNMDRRYPDYQVWDAPSTVIYLNMNGKEQQVVDILGAPEELKELERLFDDIIKKQGWRTTTDKQPQSAQSAPGSNH